MTDNPVEMQGLYLIPPGKHIQDWLDDCGMPVAEFCKRMEISRPTYYRLLNGTQPITADTALRLERVTGASASFWSKLESDYRQQVLRQEAEKGAENQKEWIKKQPISDLIKAGFLPADFCKRSFGDQVAALCSFYNVSSVDAYEEIHTEYAFAARAVKGVESNSTALTAWLQMAARTASEKIPGLPAYDAELFHKQLDEIRSMTALVDEGTMTFKDYLLKVQGSLARSGVQVTYLRKVKDVKNLNGVAFWLKDHPVIVLTLHSGAMDRIVFSLYHEAAHILNGKQDLIYVTDKENSDIEIRADQMAAEMLIPETNNKVILMASGTLESMRRLAKQLSVSVSLVIGRYQTLTKRFFPFKGYRVPSISWDEIDNWRLAS